MGRSDRQPWQLTGDLQADGTLFQEDSHRIFVPVRDDAGAFVGIADVRMLEGTPGDR